MFEIESSMEAPGKGARGGRPEAYVEIGGGCGGKAITVCGMYEKGAGGNTRIKCG
jgi:hypothetical protein